MSKSAWRMPKTWPKKKGIMRKIELAIYHFTFFFAIFNLSSGASWGRFRAPKLVLQFSKMLVLLWKSLHFWRNQGLYSKMVLRAFWCSLRAYLGGKKRGGWGYLLADQRSTYVFWSLFLCFLFFLLDMLMFFFVFFVFFCFFFTFVYVLVFFFFFFFLVVFFFCF